MKKLILIFTLVFTLFTFSLGADLSDIQDHWAVLNIMKATNNEFFSGYPDGTFKPNNTITRLEFITIMTKVLENTVDIDIDSYNNIFKYEDLDDNSWGMPFYNKLMYYAEAFSNEMSVNKGETFAKKIFGNDLEPNKPITREEAVTLMEYFLDKDKLTGEELMFSDTMESPYREEIQQFCKSGIIKGYPDGTFKPTNNITRAEASVIIVELFDNKDLIKDVQWKNESPYINTEVIRTEPEEVVLQVLLNESKNNYSMAYQYLSSIYKEDNEISNSSYYEKNTQSHILPTDFIFDENSIEIKIKKESDESVEVSFKSMDAENEYLLELVLVGIEDWYINAKKY